MTVPLSQTKHNGREKVTTHNLTLGTRTVPRTPHPSPTGPSSPYTKRIEPILDLPSVPSLSPQGDPMALGVPPTQSVFRGHSSLGRFSRCSLRFTTEIGFRGSYLHWFMYD